MSHFFSSPTCLKKFEKFLSEVVVDGKFYGHLWFSLDSDDIHLLFSCEQFTFHHTSTTPILYQYYTKVGSVFAMVIWSEFRIG